jgi:hypothetical protein
MRLDEAVSLVISGLNQYKQDEHPSNIIKRQLNFAHYRFLSDTELLTSVKRIALISRATDGNYLTNTYLNNPATTGGAEYIVPVGFNVDRIDSVYIISQNQSTKAKLKGISIVDLPSDMLATGCPVCYYFTQKDGRSDGISLYPEPDVDYFLDVHYAVNGENFLASDADEFLVPEQYSSAILSLALSRLVSERGLKESLSFDYEIEVKRAKGKGATDRPNARRIDMLSPFSGAVYDRNATLGGGGVAPSFVGPRRLLELTDVAISLLTAGGRFGVGDIGGGVMNMILSPIRQTEIVPVFEITSFTLQGGNIIELGSTVYAATFDYVCNRAPTTLVLTNDEGYPPLNVPTPLIADEIESEDYSNSTHGSTRLIELTGTEVETDVAAVTIYFYAPMYYGLSASDLTSEANIKTLTKVLDADHNYSVNFASGASRYIYITVLASLDITSIFVGGFESFVDFTPTTLNMTHNANTSSYKRYKSNAPITSAYIVTWS